MNTQQNLANVNNHSRKSLHKCYICNAEFYQYYLELHFSTSHSELENEEQKVDTEQDQKDDIGFKHSLLNRENSAI